MTDIEFTNDINIIIERQNILIKLWDNPNINKYDELIKKINANIKKNNEIRKDIPTKSVNKLILYSSTIFIMCMVLFFCITWYLKTETVNRFILFLREGYSSLNDYIKKCTTIEGASSNIFLIVLLVYAIISVFYTILSSLGMYKIYYKLRKIRYNTLDSLNTANKLIVKGLVKRKGILSMNTKLIKATKSRSTLDFMEDNIPQLTDILSYVNYIKFFIDFSKNKSLYYFPEFEEIAHKPYIKIPTHISSNIIALTDNCILLKDAFPLVESIVLSQTVGISFIDGLKFTLFDKVIQVYNYKATNIDATNSLIVLKNLGPNTNMKDIALFAKKMEELNNYVVIIILMQR